MAYTSSTYGDRIADVYDNFFGLSGDTAIAVEFLTELAGAGPALELGIGTGRIALPLAERGITVHGIDASEAMVAKLRAKSGGERLPVTIGDFTEFQLEKAFSMIFVVFNTFFAVLS